MTVLVINQQLFGCYKIYTEKRTLKENTEITDTTHYFFLYDKKKLILQLLKYYLFDFISQTENIL